MAPAVARFDAEGGHAPGWLVAAIREGYTAVGGRGTPLLSYAEMLAACDREGITTEAFEAVPQPGGNGDGTSPKPLWRRKAKVAVHEPAGVR
ncbi:MAG: hypothetical protein ACK41D_08440 [Rubricoccaceae bacterium]